MSMVKHCIAENLFLWLQDDISSLRLQEGSFLLSQLQQLNINEGLYRDDGLAVVNSTPRAIENIKKDICRILNSNGLRITRG